MRPALGAGRRSRLQRSAQGARRDRAKPSEPWPACSPPSATRRTSPRCSRRAGRRTPKRSACPERRSHRHRGQPPRPVDHRGFGDRIETDARAGAQLAYIVHDGRAVERSALNECRERNGCTRERIEVAPEHARQAINDLVLEHARSEGWDAEENKRYIDTASIYDKDPLRALARWWEMPSPRAEPHGTEVAAVAAGARHGVAPQARIVPLATDLEDAGNHFINEVGRWPMRRHIEQMDQGLRWRADAAWAARLDAEHDASDVLIRAYSSASWEPWWLEQRLGEQRKWAEAHIPATLAAYLQSDRETPTLVVHSAGNEGKPYPSGIGQIPYHFADVRGHTVTTVAIDADTQTISERSNRCGALPEDWDAARHGHHYCLAAPSRAWTVRPLDDDAGGSERFQTGAVTSFANPVVAGALALLIEHFRGTRTPEEILARVKATARRDGVYAERDVYGAGHLDIGAALRPWARSRGARAPPSPPPTAPSANARRSSRARRSTRWASPSGSRSARRCERWEGPLHRAYRRSPPRARSGSHGRRSAATPARSTGSGRAREASGGAPAGHGQDARWKRVRAHRARSTSARGARAPRARA